MTALAIPPLFLASTTSWLVQGRLYSTSSYTGCSPQA